MEGRKTKHFYLKEILHYLLVICILLLVVFAYIKNKEINEFFNKNLTQYDNINNILHYVPKVIVSVEILVVGLLINFLLNLLTKINFGLTAKTKTIINLINSLLKWVVIIATILFILSYWGVDTKVLLASVGIIALVVGLGAQSLISDILAGIFIVLEGKYVVGDIVVIDNWRGEIISIGIRTTELKDICGNIKIINNSEIRSVVNQTKLKSLAQCTINVSTREKL